MPKQEQPKDRLLTVNEVAERRSTPVGYPRRLIQERRITFVRIGRHVRIPESVVDSWISEGTVEAIVRPSRRTVA